MEAQELSFEAAFARLEEILEKMNSGSIPLELSLKLYEEADQLITTCQKRLMDAERRIETLVKDRNGRVAMGQDQKPIIQNYTQGQGK